MNQNEITEHTITVNPIYENTVYINDAVSTDVDYVDAVLINDGVNNVNNVDNWINTRPFLNCILVLFCLSFVIFILFLFAGGIELFININDGDDKNR
jgi:hypothetical protein